MSQPKPQSTAFILKVYGPHFHSFRLKPPKTPWPYARRNPDFDDFYMTKSDDFVGWEEYCYRIAGERFYYESSSYIRFIEATVIPWYFGA